MAIGASSVISFEPRRCCEGRRGAFGPKRPWPRGGACVAGPEMLFSLRRATWGGPAKGARSRPAGRRSEGHGEPWFNERMRVYLGGFGVLLFSGFGRLGRSRAYGLAQAGPRAFSRPREGRQRSSWFCGDRRFADASGTGRTGAAAALAPEPIGGGAHRAYFPRLDGPRVGKPMFSSQRAPARD